MKVKIYRGTNEIGGTCLELTAKNGKKLWVDVGSPLETKNPDISYLHNKVDALLISHPHQDHYGLMEYVGTEIPIYIGEIALDFINAVKQFTGTPIFDGNFNIIKEVWKPFVILDTFIITPYLTDHSTPESFAFLVEVDNCRFFYSGDFRSTGRKKILFENLVKNPPKDIDYLFIEGTMIERTNHLYPTEESIENGIVEIIKNQENISFVISSAQNIDRFISVYRACKRTEKTVVIDPYTAWLLDVLSKKTKNTPTIDWKEVKVYEHPAQVSRIIDERSFYSRIQLNNVGNEVFRKSSNYVYFVRDVNNKLFEKLKKHGKINVIYSQWEGYLKDDFKQYFTENINNLRNDKNYVDFHSIHTSGHAVLSDLKIYAKAIKAKKIIPIHTAFPEKFKQEFEKDGISSVELWQDGKEYTLNKIIDMNEKLKYFKLAKELNETHHNTLKEQKLHFRGNINSFSLISLSKETAEKGISNLKTKEKAESVLININLTSPKRATPEKELQAWIIDFSLNNDGRLPFYPDLNFLTSELVFINQSEYDLDSPKRDIRNDILAIDSNNSLCIIELKSKRDNNVKKQTIEFEKVVINEIVFFEKLIELFTNKKWNKKVRKIAVWPSVTGKSKKQEFLDVEEINYKKTEMGYTFS